MRRLEALLEQVLAAPDDEAPRAAYAVAVRRSDPDRAKLINVQLRIARALTTDQDRAHLTAGDLISAHGRRWAEPVHDLVEGWQFFRGFVEVVRLDAARFLSVAPQLYRRAPVLHLDLTGVRPVAAELFGSPLLARIKSLELSGIRSENDLGDPEALTLAASPYLGRLEWLDLSNNRIGTDGLEALAASTGLPRLGYLRFDHNAVPDPTPRFADEYDATSRVGRELQDRYGPRDWLDARPRFRWPPGRDQVYPPHPSQGPT
jgi:hypothetical protein